MQKASRPERMAFRDKYLAAIFAAGLMVCSAIGHAQVYQKNTGYGTEFRGLVPDSVLYLPTGCGAPAGIASLRSYGFGNGEKKRMGAIFTDSCGHHLYWFDPSDTSWHRLDSSSGGGSGGNSSFHVVTSANFSTSTNCPLPALSGQTLQVFWNDLGRFLVKGTEWDDLGGGGFAVTLGGFDAGAANYSFTVYSSSGTITPGPLPFTSADFSTATNCPIPALNGMTLQIYWNDLNRYLTSSEWTPLAGGGFSVTVPGFNASITSYSFYVFNQ